jgi:hypothetical protein
MWFERATISNEFRWGVARWERKLRRVRLGRSRVIGLSPGLVLWRTDVVQIFPNVESVIRLVGALLVEIDDEMIAAERRYIAAASVAAVPEEEGALASLPAAPRN